MRVLGATVYRGRGVVLALVIALVGMSSLVGAPAFAQPEICKEAPHVEYPGNGLVGVVDETHFGKGQLGTVYSDVGYGGLVWHVYGVGCGGFVGSPMIHTDTYVGNMAFNVAKVIVGAANRVHYFTVDGSISQIDSLVSNATLVMYEAGYLPFLALVLLIVGVVITGMTIGGNLAGVGKKAATVILALWVAAATYLTPLIYVSIVDGLVVEGSAHLRDGIYGQLNMSGHDGPPTLLHEKVVYENWLRGEFGSPGSPQAKELGRQLLNAQVCTHGDIVRDQCSDKEIAAKRAAFKELAGKMGPAYPTFQGAAGSRFGVGVLAVFQAILYAVFPLFSGLAILIASIILRVVMIFGPILGLLAMMKDGILLTVAKAVGSTLVKGLVLVMVSAGHSYILAWLFKPTSTMPVIAQMIVAGVVSALLWFAVRPLRTLREMATTSLSLVGVRSMPWDQLHTHRLMRKQFRRLSGSGTAKNTGHVDSTAPAAPRTQTRRAPTPGDRPRPEAGHTPTPERRNPWYHGPSRQARALRPGHPGPSPIGNRSRPGAGRPGAGRPGGSGETGGSGGRGKTPQRYRTHGPAEPQPQPAPLGEPEIIIPSRLDQDDSNRGHRRPPAPSAGGGLSPTPSMVDDQGRTVYKIYRPSADTLSTEPYGSRPETRD